MATFKILIGGVEYRTLDTYTIKENVGSISSSTIDVLVQEGQALPKRLQDVQVLDSNDDPFFVGLIQNLNSPSFSTGKEVKNYRLEVLSMETVFTHRYASDAFENKTTEEIVTSLFSQYISEEGITLGGILTGGQTYENYNYQHTKLYDVLTELSAAINATFFISPDKKFYFINQEDFNYVATPTHIRQLKKEDEKGDIRSVQIVTGAREETSTQTDNVIWVTGQSNYTLSYQVSSISGITINALPATYGVRGVDEDDVSITFLWSFGSNTISVNPNATTKPAATDNVVTLYQGFFDIVVTNTNDQLVSDLQVLNGTSGKIEKVFTDETLTNLTDADAKANALLDEFSESEVEVSCITHDLANSKKLDVWTFNYPELDIVGDFAIVTRTISNFGTETTIKIKLKSKNFFKKYGETFRKEEKQVRRDIKVFKSSNLSETVNVSEDLDIQLGGLVFFPSTGTDIFDPSFDEVYPV